MNSEKKTAWPSVATIGGIAKRGEKAVSESIARLIKAKLVIRYGELNWRTAFTVPLLIISKGKVIDQTSKFIDKIKKDKTEINKIEEVKIEINKLDQLKNNQKAPFAPNCLPKVGENGENDEIPF
jgi:tRNA uridine 5-carbamoylmethylation protein Kti12